MNDYFVAPYPSLPALQTDRLLLRGWRESDREPFIALSGNAEVRRYFPSVLTREQAEQMYARMQTRIAGDGFGFWAVEHRVDACFIGLLGLQHLDFLTPEPLLEIGWWLEPAYWHLGLATEGACCMRDYAFRELGREQLVSVTTTTNVPSMRVMQRIGMTSDPRDNFPHPRVPDDSPLKEHVLYRMDRAMWERCTA